MALIKKGTRGINVDGEEYRWRIRKKPTYDQGAFATAMTFAVEHSDAEGSTLIVTTTVPRPDNWLLKRSASVTPARVADAIRQALRCGWSPGVSGTPFILNFDMGCQEAASTNLRPARRSATRESRKRAAVGEARRWTKGL
jgi:hypothetical protein